MHFSLTFLDFLAHHRNIYLTKFFLGASFMGSAWSYVLLIMLLYVAWDKRLAMRISVLLLAATSLNDLLKIWIANPRPFVREGTYLQKWAVSPAEARNLALEYSTPSGHAMSSAAFYAYLYAFLRGRWLRVVVVLAIVAIGCSRPYLGVHYAEDVLMGWALGLLVAWGGLCLTEPLTAFWSRRSYGVQILLVVAGSLALCLLAAAVGGWSLNGQPYGVVACAGFVTGNVIARRLELRLVNFDPRSGGVAVKLLRLFVTLALITFTLLLFGWLAGAVAAKFSLLGYLLAYLRYAAAGTVGLFVAPWLFTRMKLAATLPVQVD